MSSQVSKGGEDESLLTPELLNMDALEQKLARKLEARLRKLQGEESSGALLDALAMKDMTEAQLLEVLDPARMDAEMEQIDTLVRKPTEIPELVLYQKLVDKFPELAPKPWKSLSEEDHQLGQKYEEVLYQKELAENEARKRKERNEQVREFTDKELERLLPEGYPAWGEEQRDFLGTRALLWRRFENRLAKELEALKEAGFPTGTRNLILDGPQGIGKTAALVQLVVHAREQGWLVVYLDAWEMTRGGRVVRSRAHQDRFDQVQTGRATCERIAKGSRDQLASLKLKGSGVPLEGFEGSTLLDLVEFGASEENQLMSCSVLTWFRQELSLITEMPVMLAVDNLNAFHRPSAYLDMDCTKFKPSLMSPEKLTLARLFRDHTTSGLLNGVSVMALSDTAPQATRHFREQVDHTKELKAQLRTVAPLDLDSVRVLCKFWAKNDDFVTKGFGTFTQKYALALSAGRPSELWRFAKFN